MKEITIWLMPEELETLNKVNGQKVNIFNNDETLSIIIRYDGVNHECEVK